MTWIEINCMKLENFFKVEIFCFALCLGKLAKTLIMVYSLSLNIHLICFSSCLINIS